jgi:hypothetical protein
MKEMRTIKHRNDVYELVHEDADKREDDLQKIGLQFVRKETWGVQILEIKVYYYKRLDMVEFAENHIMFTNTEFETIFNIMKGVENVEQSV